MVARVGQKQTPIISTTPIALAALPGIVKVLPAIFSPLLLSQIGNAEAWGQHPLTMIAATAYGLSGTSSLMAHLARQAGFGEKLDKTSVANVARQMDRARIAVQDRLDVVRFGAAGMALIGGAAMVIAGVAQVLYTTAMLAPDISWLSSGLSLIDSGLVFFLPMLTYLYRPLSAAFWPRHEMNIASQGAMQRLVREMPQVDAGQSLSMDIVALRAQLRSFLPVKKIPQFTLSPKVEWSLDGLTLVMTYGDIAKTHRSAIPVTDDIARMVRFATDVLPEIHEIGGMKGVLLLAEQWADAMCVGHGVREIRHVGLDNLPQGSFNIAVLSHLKTTDVPGFVAPIRRIGVFPSQLGKRGLSRIPGMKAAIKTGFLNPLDEKHMERSMAHLSRKDLPEGVRAANLSFVPAHRTNGPMAATLSELKKTYPVPEGRDPVTHILERMKEAGIEGILGKSNKGETTITFTPPQDHLFLPKKGICYEAAGTGRPIVPASHRFVRQSDGTDVLEIYWYPPIEAHYTDPKDKPASATEANRLYDELLRRIKEEIIPGSSYLRTFHPYFYKKKRKPIVREMVEMVSAKRT